MSSYFKEKRIGHSGTLDPMAYGVLPIFLGKATRLIEYTDGFNKTYVAECKFGTFTDTEDSTGQPVLPDDDMNLTSGVTLLADHSAINERLIPQRGMNYHQCYLDLLAHKSNAHPSTRL